MGPDRHGDVSASLAGAKSLDFISIVHGSRQSGHTCMNAVAIITPEPKYLVMKNAMGGTCILFDRAAIMGKSAP